MQDLDQVRKQLAQLILPADVHAELLWNRSPATGSPVIAAVMVWADRHYNDCPRCGQPVPMDLTGVVPALLESWHTQDMQPTTVDRDQKHGCGLWLSVDYTVVKDPTDLAAILAAATELTERRAALVAAERDRIREDLTKALRDILRQLAEPLDDETAEDRDVRLSTGSDTDPGIYRDPDRGWVAWAWDPIAAGPEDVITVLASGLEQDILTRILADHPPAAYLRDTDFHQELWLVKRHYDRTIFTRVVNGRCVWAQRELTDNELVRPGGYPGQPAADQIDGVDGDLLVDLREGSEHRLNAAGYEQISGDALTVDALVEILARGVEAGKAYAAAME